MADIKAQSDKLRFPRAAAADRCGVENYKISYLCGNATVMLQSHVSNACSVNMTYTFFCQLCWNVPQVEEVSLNI